MASRFSESCQSVTILCLAGLVFVGCWVYRLAVAEPGHDTVR